MQKCKKSWGQILRKGFTKKITVYRILDSRKEDFKLRKLYEAKADVVNVITAPEIEMLIIVHKGKYAEYSRVKSHIKPSEFCKETLKLPSVKTAEFIENYFSDIEDLLYAIKEYKRLSNIPKNEKCLADLIIEWKIAKSAMSTIVDIALFFVSNIRLEQCLEKKYFWRNIVNKS